MKRTLIEWWCIGAVVSVIIVVDGQGDVVHDGNASHVSNITTDSHITDSYLTTTVYDHIDVSGESTEFTPAEITRGQGWEQDTDKGLYTYARNTNDNSSYVNETFTSTTHYSQEMNDFLGEGRAVVEDFFERYSNNRTQEVDVIFILDRSGSVPRKGWYSMLNFIKDLLEHFTVDADNTRVAIITFSTKANMDINDLKPGRMTDRENKCTLMRRIEDYIEKKVPYGYTATYDALDLAYNALLTSRPTAKKAIFVLTDGKSNIGPPPVKIAFDIISLQWDQKWDGEKHGPQVEIYALGVENANKPELISMATDLPHHVFLIPNFQKFEQLARSLHGGRLTSANPHSNQISANLPQLFM